MIPAYTDYPIIIANDDYYGGPKGMPAIKNVVIRSIPDMGTQQAELMSGGIHWMYNVKKDIGEAMAKTGKADYQLGPSLRVGFLVLDAGGYSGEGNPITKLDVRRAMNHAINRESIATNETEFSKLPCPKIIKKMSKKMKHNKKFGNLFYRISKAALNCSIKNLSYDFKGRFTIVALHPGYTSLGSGKNDSVVFQGFLSRGFPKTVVNY